MELYQKSPASWPNKYAQAHSIRNSGVPLAQKRYAGECSTLVWTYHCPPVINLALILWFIYLDLCMHLLIFTDLRFLTINHCAMLLTIACVSTWYSYALECWIPKLIIVVHMLMYSKKFVSYYACHYASCKTICILLICSSLNMYIVVSCHFDTHFVIRISQNQETSWWMHIVSYLILLGCCSNS